MPERRIIGIGVTTGAERAVKAGHRGHQFSFAGLLIDGAKGVLLAFPAETSK